ncbi:tRNA-processing RNAse BN [Oceanospirillum multiglobuliferum]|uniref:UPF0761 membrane protein BTE48_15440 n=1 Tax=Oceanospirillum multiglobuliferum TaxID=64969 RepID=A0A1T4SL34_9GAMM|nr:YihY family inner membrane protein [Oceanospirillum multiglobuliferum]OPX54188.1 hypothetical protein BTE48_15440 [Oceanospirillum multiglobuliferum]SKA28912.1 tRNA-processing RNAse BN [Oceanospirillum multiglobuliferum]
MANIKEYWLPLARYVIARFIKNESSKVAASLTYTSLFAIVPMMTVAYGILSAMPSIQGLGAELENNLFSSFVPESGQVVQGYLADFAKQAKNLTIVGVLFLVVTAVMMMSAIEKAFNKIWSVSEARSGASSFLLYWAVLTLGPILLGAGFAFSSYLLSQQLFLQASDSLGVTSIILRWFPVATSSMAFTMMYILVPNCHVPWKNALVGGLFTAVCFELAKQGFTLFISASPSYQVVYGAFAAVPLFLLWVYLSWNLTLLGATLVMALGRFRTDWSLQHNLNFTVALNLLNLLYSSWQQGQETKASAVKEVLAPLSFSQQRIVVKSLQNSGLIVRTEKKEWRLARSLETINIWQLMALLPWQIPEISSDNESLLWPDARTWLLQYQNLNQTHHNQAAHTLFESKGA